MLIKENNMQTVFFSDDDMCTTQKLQLARVQNWFIANNWGLAEKAEDASIVLSLSCNGWSLLEKNSYDRIKKFRNVGMKDFRI